MAIGTSIQHNQSNSVNISTLGHNSPKFDAKKISLGRSVTFPLRLGWLPKLAREISEGGFRFIQEDAVVRLGVGKNMVDAIRFWARAAGVINEESGEVSLTSDFGEVIFGENGSDLFLEDEATLWLLHWKLSSNPTIATTNYLFFNRFHKAEFSEETATNGIASLLESEGARFSRLTLGRDVNTILRMYALRSSAFTEETLDSPFPMLNLLVYDTQAKVYRMDSGVRNTLHPAVLGFTLAEIFSFPGTNNIIPVRDLLYGDGINVSPGAVFRFTEDGLLTALEKATSLIRGDMELHESAGVWQVYKTGEPSCQKYLSLCFNRV